MWYRHSTNGCSIETASIIRKFIVVYEFISTNLRRFESAEKNVRDLKKIIEKFGLNTCKLGEDILNVRSKAFHYKMFNLFNSSVRFSEKFVDSF